MKRLVLMPNGWACTLEECPPGLFIFNKQVCFKSEYHNNGNVEAFNNSGEYLSINQKEIVQPVDYEWQEDE